MTTLDADAQLIAAQNMRRYANTKIGHMQAGCLAEYTVDNAHRLGVINTAQIDTAVGNGALTLTISVRDTANARLLADELLHEVLADVCARLAANNDLPRHHVDAASIQPFGHVTATLVIPARPAPVAWWM